MRIRGPVRQLAGVIAVTLTGLTPSTSSAQAPTGGTAQPPRAPGAYMNISFVGQAVAGWSTEPNVRSLQLGDHDPRVRGFTVPNAELALDGTVDPHFKAFVNVVHKLDENAETGTELEEMFLITTSLPRNLQLKVGQFFSEFGRLNVLHPHAWASVDQSLVLNRMFGAEGLRGQGARLSWLLPTPFYAEALLGVMNSAGGTMSSFRSEESAEIHGGAPIEREVKGLGDLLYVPRLATSFDLTPNQTLLIGASGAFGPNNSGLDARTSIAGVDGFWKWKSARANQGFPFVSVQSEYLSRSYSTDPRAAVDDLALTLGPQTLKDAGSYTQLLWGIRPRVVAGLRAESVTADKATYVSPERGDRSRWAPSLTWYPSEYSKLRLQYNYDNRVGIGRDHSIWMQFEFLLGAHSAHKF